jgi:anti-sigma factor RsiW
MSAVPTQERTLVAYLLGRLPEEEQVELEERYMEEDDLHEELLATADDLIHAYLDDGLSAGDRERFETYFLASPRRRQRLAFVRGLLAALDRLPAEPAQPPVHAARAARALTRPFGDWK